MGLILIIGGSDTGRAPVAATLLRRRLSRADISVGSAGILGHDGAEIQPEAALALEHLGAEVPLHTARSLNDQLVNEAACLIAIDRGTARAVEMRYPHASIAALPDLAGSTRDVPDPFRMTLDAWIVYARELDAQLTAALPTILSTYQAAPAPASDSSPATELPVTAHAASGALTDQAAVLEQLQVLLDGLQRIPEVVDWKLAHAAVRMNLQKLNQASNASDMRPAAIAMLLGLINADEKPLSQTQLAILHQASSLLSAPLDAAQLGQLATAVTRWHA